MTMARQAAGKDGEARAAEALERLGYAILERRYRTKHGEIDIVARDGETLVFVEVKVRLTSEYGTAAEAVTPRKQRRLVRMATEYLALKHVAECRCRFDVVAIDGEGESARLTVYRDAFWAA